MSFHTLNPEAPINVCDSIAEKCRLEFDKESLVIPNVAPYFPSLKANKVDSKCIKIIHHGLAIRERRLEVMVEAAKMLGDGYRLDLMLVSSDEAYFECLKELVRAVPNVRIIAPVPYQEIIPFINHYDIGLFILPERSYNYKIALPNKLFEFVQARLCSVVSPSFEMARMVQKHNIGLVMGGFDAVTCYNAIRQLDAEAIEAYKQNASKAAMEESAENYQEPFVRAVLA